METGRDAQPQTPRHSVRVCCRKGKKILTHTYTHTLAGAHTGRIEYEGIAAPAGCVPAVTASELAAATRECAVQTARRRKKKRR